MSKQQAKLLLAAVIIVRSTGYAFSKTGLQTMPTFNLLAIRFALASIAISLLFRRQLFHISMNTVIHAAILGAFYFCTLTAELNALKKTPTSVVSFIENTSIVLVPLFESMLCGKKLAFSTVARASLALTGVAIMTLTSGTAQFSPGYLLAALAAVLYAFSIITTDRFSHMDNPLALGVIQLIFLSLYATIATFAFETPRMPESSIEWGVIIVLAFICTGFGLTLQPVAQSKLDSSTTSLFCALNPVVASTVGALFLSEHFTAIMLVGFIIILTSIILTSIGE